MYDLDYFAENLERPRKGSDYVLGLCPYHDDTTPSLVVYINRPHYECFSCGARGSLGQLAHTLGSSFHSGSVVGPDRTAWKDRPNWNRGDLAQYCLDAHRRYSDLTQTHWYMEDRGLAGAVEPYGLGWDNGWYTIPVRDSDGRVKAAVARAGPHIERKTQMRFDMPLGQEGQLYIPDWGLWKVADVVYVALGVYDAISMAVSGMACASPTAGKKSLNPAWFDDVDVPVVVIPDRDESVDAHHLAMGLDWRGRVHLPDYQGQEKDPNDILVNRGREGLVSAMEKSK